MPACVATDRNDQQRSRHDDETFRVAEELMLLSNCAKEFHYVSTKEEKMDKATSNESIRREEPTNMTKPSKHTDAVNVSVSFGIELPGKSVTALTRKRSRPTEEFTDILNSKCDVAHSELLKEHRTRFRRVRRRWNLEQTSKKQAYLARFQVQGIPLVQHLERLTHWR